MLLQQLHPVAIACLKPLNCLSCLVLAEEWSKFGNDSLTDLVAGLLVKLRVVWCHEELVVVVLCHRSL